MPDVGFPYGKKTAYFELIGIVCERKEEPIPMVEFRSEISLVVDLSAL